MTQPLPEPWVLCGMFQWHGGPYRLGVRLTAAAQETSGPPTFADPPYVCEYAWFDEDGKRCELGEE